MATLEENIDKVVAAHAALKAALEAKGVTVPEGAKLSDMARLVEGVKPASQVPKWERPHNWPRIDLIPIRGISYHVMYLIVRKPAPGHGLCFAATVAANASTWYIERISVSEDGKVVTPVEGSRQTSSGTGSTKIDYQFPADDPVGTIYAMKVAVTDPTKLFSTAPNMASPNSLYYYLYNSSVILEVIVRSFGVKTHGFGSSANSYPGPIHFVSYHADKGFGAFAFRGNVNLNFIEFREGSVLKIESYDSPNLNGLSDSSRCVADWDDDFIVERVSDAGFDITKSTGKFLPPRIGVGDHYPLERVRIIQTTSSEPVLFDWETSTRPLREFFRRSTTLTKVSLPDGFGSAATNVSYCFYNCSSLQTLALPDGFGSAATNVSYCFHNCFSLQTLALPDGFGSAATNVQNCFYGCFSLQTLALPDGFGSAATNVSYCFHNCSSLQTLALPDGFGSAATNVSYCFYGCPALTTVTGAIKFPISFDIHWSTKLTHESLVNIISGLVTVTSTKTLTIGATNKNKLNETGDDAILAAASEKGWTIT